MALPDFIFALCALLGGILLPFTGLYEMPRSKRWALAPEVSFLPAGAA